MQSQTVLTILGVRPVRIGGVELFAKELSQVLGTAGWTSVLCFRSEPPDLVREFLQLPNVQFETLSDPQQWNYQTTMRYIELVRTHRPSVVHVSFTGFLGPYVRLAKMLGVNRVYATDQTSRPAGYKHGKQRLGKRLAARMLLGSIDKVFCVSNYVRDCHCGLGALPPEYFEVLYNCTDVSRAMDKEAMGAEFRAKHNLPPDCTIVSQVCNMIPEKGVANLLAAAKQVIAAIPDAHFVLAGEGKYRQDYEELAVELRIDDNVHFVGLVDDPIGGGLYAASDIVCQVSQWEEAFGYVIAEAMAAGKPVIGTRAGAIPEVIDDERTGYLVERGDIDALAARLIELARDPELCASLGEAGREKCQRSFDVRDSVKRLMQHYGVVDNETNGTAHEVSQVAHEGQA